MKKATASTSKPGPRRYSRPALSAENRAGGPIRTMSKTARINWLLKQFKKTAAGNRITEDNALDIDTVFTCVRVLSESMASLPFDLMRKRVTGKRVEITKAIEHPVYELLRWQPNEEITAYELRMWMMIDCLIRGRGAAQVVRNGRGVPVGLWPLYACNLTPRRLEGSGRLVWHYKNDTTETVLEQDEVFTFAMFPYAGLIGWSLVSLQREILGTAKAANDYAAEFFANGVVPTGTLEIPEELDEEAYKRIRKDWEESHTGEGKRHRTPILEGGAKFNPLQTNHQETQLLETRKFNRSGIAGLFRVPAHLINDLEKATFSNIEHQDLGFGKHTLRPWMTNIEQRARLTFLKRSERAELFFKHNDRDLLRGDFPSRAEGYSKLISAGVMAPNDALEAEDMNTYEGGDRHFINGTMRDVNEPAQPSSGSGSPAPNTDTETPGKTEE